MIIIEGLNRRYSDSENRSSVIKKIRDIRYNNAFKYYKEKFYVPDSSNAVSDDIMKKLFTDYKLLDQVINAFVSYCPTLDIPTPEYINKRNKKRQDLKLKLLKQAMSEIRWNELNTQIYDTLESEGDCFFYIYFEKKKEEDKFLIPKLRYLDSEKMKNMIVDDSNTPLAYIYVDDEYDEVINYITGKIDETNKRKVTYIFEKGKVHKIINNKKSQGTLLEKDEDGKINLSNATTVDNLDFYKDIIPIIHIHSKKRQDEKFSLIPAEDYVELCLQLAQIQSDIRATNRQLGFPRITLLDCEYVEGDGRIGGVKIAKTLENSNSIDQKQGQVIQHNSATNESFFTEEKNVTDYLYNLVCITNPTLMNRVGSSDSSKVLQQVNARMEKKIESYINNIIEAFKPYFRILLLANNLYDDATDLDMSFKKPVSIIKNSIYDEKLIDQLDLNNGTATIQSKLRDKGNSSEAIENHMEELNKEISNGNNDIQYNKSTKQIINSSNNANNIE